MANQVNNKSGNAGADSHLRIHEEIFPTTTSSPSLKPDQDRTSDIEASEGPVREKLKKTSIASIPRQADPSPAEGNETGTPPTIDQVLESDAQVVKESLETNRKDRGRPEKKRSFDDLGNDEAVQSEIQSHGLASVAGRERKRSKDVHTNRANKDIEVSHQPADLLPVESGDTFLVSNDTDLVYEGMDELAFSSRKKRSRDQMDADTHREQKIPATEEAKAYRRSDEQERDEKPPEKTVGLVKDGTDTTLEIGTNTERIPNTGGEDTCASCFSNTSQISPLGNLLGSKPSPQVSSTSERAPVDHTSQTPAKGLGTSAFSSSSQPSASPFGELGPSPFAEARPFGSGSFASGETAHSGSRPGKAPVQAATNGFSVSQPVSTSLNANVMAPSPFGGAAASSNGTSFGSASVFGHGFGQSSAFGGSKLTSFADPKGGDLTLGKLSSIKPMGTAKGSDDERSDSEGEGVEEKDDAVGDEETDPRFQYQQMDTGEEGEDSIFSSNRAKLYGWEGGAWKERGAGTFRFNVSTSESEDTADPPKKARFIMRAHQTYRILLNAPVFKQMLIGDPAKKGEKPTGKTLSIPVVMDDGKPMPYLIRLSDAIEAATLYEEVRNLQEQL